MQDKVLFTPLDSAQFATQIPNCQSWPGCVAGTMESHDHILLSWMATQSSNKHVYPPKHDGSACKSMTQMLRSTVCHLAKEGQQPYANATNCPNDNSYWEADILGSVPYPHGVKLVTADFAHTFGTPTGQHLRDWYATHPSARARARPLVMTLLCSCVVHR